MPAASSWISALTFSASSMETRPHHSSTYSRGCWPSSNTAPTSPAVLCPLGPSCQTPNRPSLFPTGPSPCCSHRFLSLNELQSTLQISTLTSSHCADVEAFLTISNCEAFVGQPVTKSCMRLGALWVSCLGSQLGSILGPLWAISEYLVSELIKQELCEQRTFSMGTV